MIRLIPIIILLMACEQKEFLNPVDPELTEAQCISLGYQDECGVCDIDTSNDGFMDECGVCDSDTSNDCVQDCAGTWGGTLAIDECGVCGGNNSICAGCDGVPNSGLVDDYCGVCGGDDSSCSNCIGVPSLIYLDSDDDGITDDGYSCTDLSVLYEYAVLNNIDDDLGGNFSSLYNMGHPAQTTWDSNGRLTGWIITDHYNWTTFTISSLPQSISNLTFLTAFNLNGYHSVQNIPEEICDLYYNHNLCSISISLTCGDYITETGIELDLPSCLQNTNNCSGSSLYLNCP